VVVQQIMVMYGALALVLHAAAPAKAHGWSSFRLAPTRWRSSQHRAQEWISTRGGALSGAVSDVQIKLAEEEHDDEGEDEEEDEEEIGLYVLVVDPMDCNGREFCKKIQVGLEG